MALILQTLLNREKAVGEEVPYTIHVSPENIRTQRGDVLTVIKLAGAAHEAADIEDVQAWHAGLNGMLRNIAGPDVALWRHTIRRERNDFPAGEFEATFARELNDKYRKVLSKERMFVNDLYLTLVLRGPNQALRLFGGSQKREAADVRREIEDQSSRLDDLAKATMASLDRYRPERLGLYELNGRSYSGPVEFLAFLVNGEWQPMPAPRQRIGDAIPTSRVTFGTEVGELRTATARSLFAMIAVNEYPDATETGEINQLLTLPYPFVLTQSFAYLDKTKALGMIRTQKNKLVQTGDAAGSQIDALDEAADDLQSNRVAFGEHHLSLLLSADDPKTLLERVSQARSNLSESGFIVAREDLALEAAYWAQLPGNFQHRPRPAPISSLNFAGLTALHNFPHGKADGNQWGPALTLLKTTSGTPYFFNLHLPIKGKRADGQATDDERVPGNTLLLGPTGAGKTVLQTFALAQAEKFRPTVFTFDKDYGQEIFIRAMGGRYSILKTGERTGFNPFLMEPTPANVQFLEDLVMKLAQGNKPYSADQESELAHAVRGLMNMPRENRNLTTLRQFLPPTDPDGPHARLEKWCNGGSLAWVFDNPTDSIDLTGTRYFGFDVTDFLEQDEIRTPVIMYLFHRMESLIGNGRFILNMDEFWRLLMDPYFQRKANDVIKTIRKRDGVGFFATQSPQDVLKSPIAHTIIEGCVTQMYLPNPKAAHSDYVEGFKLTNREYGIVKHDIPEANLRGFLLKQGSNACVCELNLAGFNDELAVLSGTTATVEIARRAIERAGNDPDTWLPVFHQYRRGL